ncbi:MAG: BlaI/MecI/CopY family transcriptional regulator [Clostridia bacterium]|nr:BlaI/MecI/CopY family transcriptional regulator [Clostridia bacterium]
MKLFDSEIKLLEIIWQNEPISAKEISLIADKTIGWNKNTTYTIIKKAIEKGYVKREDPGFICTTIVKKEDAQKSEAIGLIDRLFDGSRKALFSALLEDKPLSESEIAELRKLIDKE